MAPAPSGRARRGCGDTCFGVWGHFFDGSCSTRNMGERGGVDAEVGAGVDVRGETRSRVRVSGRRARRAAVSTAAVGPPDSAALRPGRSEIVGCGEGPEVVSVSSRPTRPPSGAGEAAHWALDPGVVRSVIPLASLLRPDPPLLPRKVTVLFPPHLFLSLGRSDGRLPLSASGNRAPH